MPAAKSKTKTPASKNGKAAVQTVSAEAAPTETIPAEPIALTEAEEAELFEDAYKAEQAITEAEALVSSAKKALDERLKKIADNVGCGPFQYKGRSFRIGNKNGGYFYKSLPRPTVRKIGR